MKLTRSQKIALIALFQGSEIRYRQDGCDMGQYELARDDYWRRTSKSVLEALRLNGFVEQVATRVYEISDAGREYCFTDKWIADQLDRQEDVF